MNRFRKYISAVLLFVLCFYAAPKELVHAFFHHDTEDAIITHTTETAVGNAHEHCDLLQLTSPPFQYSITAFSFCASYIYVAYRSAQHVFLFGDLAQNYFLRGPPVI